MRYCRNFSKIDLVDINRRISNMCDSMYRICQMLLALLRFQNAALGHCRLSIIDLQNASNQPMCSNNGRYYLVYNGEIVNHKEIRASVKYQYRTNSDTEVILAAVQVKGIDWLLKNADGMFAFILYDTVENAIYVARDRFGIKPVFYTITKDESLVIASEVKGILSSGLVDANLYQNALDDYLAFRYVREPYSFFKDIYQVPHATY